MFSVHKHTHADRRREGERERETHTHTHRCCSTHTHTPWCCHFAPLLSSSTSEAPFGFCSLLNGLGIWDIFFPPPSLPPSLHLSAPLPPSLSLSPFTHFLPQLRLILSPAASFPIIPPLSPRIPSVSSTPDLPSRLSFTIYSRHSLAPAVKSGRAHMTPRVCASVHVLAFLHAPSLQPPPPPRLLSNIYFLPCAS